MSEKQGQKGTHFYILLDAPNPASAAERRAWDAAFKHPLSKSAAENVKGGNPTPSVETQLAGLHLEKSTPSPMPVSSQDDFDGPPSPAGLTETLVDQNDARVCKKSDLEESASGVEVHPSFSEHGHRIASRATGVRPRPRIETYMGTQLSQGVSGKRFLSNQGYTAKLSILQEVPSHLVESFGTEKLSSRFRVCIDTGSDVTWLYGLNYRELIQVPVGSQVADQSKDSPTGSQDRIHRLNLPPLEDSDTEFALRDWTLEKPAFGVMPGEPHREVHLNTGYRYELKAGKEVIQEGVSLATASYAMPHAHIAVSLSDRVENVTVLRCYNWAAKSFAADIRIAYRFAVAIGVTWRMDVMAMDGILALGLAGHQDCFSQTAEDAYAPYQSFLKALQTSGVLQEPESDEGGIIMYFALRAHENSPPQRRRRAQNKDVLQSWLAFNQWPSPYFYPEWSGIFSIPSRTGEWGVPLVEIQFRARSTEPDSTDTGAFRDIDEATYAFGERGINVSLDTGSSLSYLPLDFINHLKTTVFPDEPSESTDDIPRAGHAGTKRPEASRANETSFTISKKHYKLESYRICLVFGPDDHGGRFELWLPCDTFLAAENPTILKPSASGHYEGLVVGETSPPDEPPLYTLGVSFFQSAIVALHKPDPPVRPYVRLASAFHGDLGDDYQMCDPPVYDSSRHPK